MTRNPSWTLLDTNVLVYAHNRQAPLFDKAAEILDAALRREGLYCVAPQNLAEFYAVVTDPHRFPAALSAPEGAKRLERLWRSRTLHKIYPARGTYARAAHLAALLNRRGSAFFDALLAQTAMDNGVVQVLTANVRDFEGIPGISVEALSD